MTDTIPQQAASAEEVARLREQVTDLGKAVTNLTADVAERLAIVDAIIRRKLGVPLARADESLCEPVAYGDPVSTRIQARKRRLEASGLVVLPGGAR